MSLLEQVGKPADRPIVATICGDSGLGKTTLAATFPTPIVIRAEDGLQAISEDLRPDAFPMVDGPDSLWDQIRTLLSEDHNYKTLIIDSVTALERMFIQSVIDSDSKNPRTINQALGGYGAGLNAVATMHQRLRQGCGMLNTRKGMHIVFVAHADTETIELPDSDPYTRYNLRLGKKSVAPYVDDSDVVGFLKLQTFYKGDGERKKATSTGARLLVCHATAANVSKNRFGIAEELLCEQNKNPLKPFVKSLN